MKIRKLIMITLLLLGSCKKYDSIISNARDFKEAHSEKRTFDGEVEPVFPNERENDKTLLGIDTNKNGVRDDIDIWINYVGVDYNHRMALRQLAREEVKRLMAGASENTKAYDQVAKDLYDALQCAEFIEFEKFFKDLPPSSAIVQLTYNTKQREKGYEQFHRSTLVYKSNIKEMSFRKGYFGCQFKIEELQNMIDKRKQNLK